MSYEGYEQRLCQNGHYSEIDAHWANGLQSCPHCQAPGSWFNCVDDTNGDAYGIIPSEEWEKWLLKPEVKETCNLGHVHVTSQAVYRIPSEDERNAARRLIKYVNGKAVYQKFRG